MKIKKKELERLGEKEEKELSIWEAFKIYAEDATWKIKGFHDFL